MSYSKTLKLTVYAMLTAIIILMAFTPLGYLKIGAVQITFIMIPVVVGSMLSPACGAYLGAVFGATSFLQCFGLDAFGTALLDINPFYTALLCFVPRILMGFACGWIFRGLSRVEKSGWLACTVTSLSGALINTALFVGALILLFGRSAYITETIGAGVWKIITFFVTLNAAVEAVVCLIIGTAVSKAFFAVYQSRFKTK